MPTFTLRRDYETGVVEGRHPKSQRLQRIGELRALTAEKQKVARLLVAADLAEEAEPHQKAAENALAEALAIESDPAGNSASVSV